MTQINYEKEHRKLWNWLADHPLAHKADYFDGWDYDSIPMNECFACEAADQEYLRMNVRHICSCCPLGGESVVGCSGGLFAWWWEALSPKTRRKLALQIANLPWRGVRHEADQL
nr:MAG TPA: hypothetical protein [Caudoviricetes sp.]